MPSFPSNQAFCFEATPFQLIFKPFSRVILDTETHQPVLFVQIAITGTFRIYTNQQKSNLLLECPSQSHSRLAWNVLTPENDPKKTPIANIKTTIWSRTTRMKGIEKWTINDSQEKPLLIFKSDESESLKKRILELLTNLYHPTHQYNIWNIQEKPVARLWTKRGLWKTKADLVFETSATELERQATMAIFVAMLF